MKHVILPLIVGFIAATMSAQEFRFPKPATPPQVVQADALDSGAIDNFGGERVVFSRQITFGMTAWLQFRFGEKTSLSEGS